MSPQRQRMIEAMILAGLSEGTQAAYLRAVWQLAKHYRRAPDQLSEEEVRAYLLDLRQRGVARGTFEPEPRVFSDGEAAVTQDTSLGSTKGWTVPLMVGQPGRDRPWTKSCVWSGSTV
jgi:hypothetical protein